MKWYENKAIRFSIFPNYALYPRGTSRNVDMYLVASVRMGKSSRSQGGGKGRYVSPGVSSGGKKGSGYLGDRKLIPRIKEVGI